MEAGTEQFVDSALEVLVALEIPTASGMVRVPSSTAITFSCVDLAPLDEQTTPFSIPFADWSAADA